MKKKKPPLQTVITRADADRLIGKRIPMEPVEIEQAVKAIMACTTFDEAKYWHDRATALEAWAKIHKEQKVTHAAKMQQLYAFERWGQIAELERPTKRGGTRESGEKGGTKGARSWLMENGLSKKQAGVARHLALNPNVTKKAAELPRPPSPSNVWLIGSDKLHNWSRIGSPAASLRSTMRDPDVCFSAISEITKASPKVADTALRLLNDLIEALPAFKADLQKALRK